ncbi:hypothetical protein DAPPUDRAFT_99687 [Daphnia pulex]|uniref:Uncharacterized protein n=1 Tax=Daphnia pulex TaxID=6669 RepID=E9G7Q7_DAPPU|nr:hypothetical protein DAPPUDRAFT_99687 [Daphnia pulex]|eukprot:EFX84522.1 hypothetical protein DAPPUDRAFT_99687 [Daphnia pulex]
MENSDCEKSDEGDYLQVKQTKSVFGNLKKSPLGIGDGLSESARKRRTLAFKKELLEKAGILMAMAKQFANETDIGRPTYNYYQTVDDKINLKEAVTASSGITGPFISAVGEEAIIVAQQRGASVKRKIFDRTESDIQDVVVISDLDEAYSEVSNELPPTPPPSRLSTLLAAPTVAIGKRTVTAPDPATGRKTFSASSDENVAASAALTPPAFAVRMRTATASGLVPDASRKTITSSSDDVAISAPLTAPNVAIREKTITARVLAANRKTISASLNNCIVTPRLSLSMDHHQFSVFKTMNA